MPRLCKTCKYYKPSKLTKSEACMHPRNMSLVDGVTPKLTPDELRERRRHCYINGEWYESSQ